MPLGGVEHQWQIDIGDNARDKLSHITLPITADVVDIHIENVGVFFDLSACNSHKSIPVFLVEELTNFLGSTGIQSFANDQEGVVLLVTRGPINGGCCRFIAQ